jgi:hypothetical protein
MARRVNCRRLHGRNAGSHNEQKADGYDLNDSDFDHRRPVPSSA